MVDLEGHDIVVEGGVEDVRFDGDHHPVAHQTVEHGHHGGEGSHAERDAAEVLTAEESSTLIKIQTLVGAVVGEHSSSIGHRASPDQGRKSLPGQFGRRGRTFGPTGRGRPASIVDTEFIRAPHSSLPTRRSIMKALVYHGPGSKAWEEVPDPEVVEVTDAIVRVDCTTICGSDLHILKGDVPEVTDGRILGHEAVGTVETVGSGVTTVAPGDRVLVSCISACGRCRFCREGRYGQCLGGGGWILGHLIDGTQAELVRVPFRRYLSVPVAGGRP